MNHDAVIYLIMIIIKEIREKCMALKTKLLGRSELEGGRIFPRRQDELIFDRLHLRKAVCSRM